MLHATAELAFCHSQKALLLQNFIHHVSGKHRGKLVGISVYHIVQLINLLHLVYDELLHIDLNQQVYF